MTKKIQQNQAADQLHILPQSLMAEGALLGVIMLDNDALSQVTESIDKDDFYRPGNQEIFNTILVLSKKNQQMDLGAVANHLNLCRKLDEVGGSSYLSSLVENVSRSANLTVYIKIIKNNSLIRQLITISTEIINYSCEKNTSILVGEAERLINEVSRNCEQSEIKHIGKIVESSYADIDYAYNRNSGINGVSTGFSDLDDITKGFQRSELIVIAGRTGMGKTALALNIAKNCAVHPSCSKVAFFTLEMSKELLVTRLLSIISGVKLHSLRGGVITDESWPSLAEATAIISELPIYIDDTSGISISEIRAKVRRLKKDKGLDMVVVDYVQLLLGDSNKQERNISYISRSLKAMAKELNVPVVALSQIDLDIDLREDRRPQLSDLHESGVGALGQDADVVMFVYREELYNPHNKGTAEILVQKQRNGPTGVVNMRFLSWFSTFHDPLVHFDESDFAYSDEGDFAHFDNMDEDS